MVSNKHVTIYTDGACTGNPGPGGYGVVLLFGERRRELSGGFRRTTNNRMELMGPIEGLESLKQSCRVTLHSDSQYVVQAINKGWAKRWRVNGWMRNKREQAVSPDLLGEAPRSLREARGRLSLGSRTRRRPGERTLRSTCRPGRPREGSPGG